MKKIISALLMGLFLCGVPTVEAKDKTSDDKATKRAWEFGIGGSIYRLNRFSVIDFQQDSATGNYLLNTQKKDVLFGGNVYVARELNSYFTLDLQGFIGFTRDKLRSGKESRWVIKPELGLQWRLGKYLNSKYIDPYLRAGVAYLYKDFNIVYNGVEGESGKEMQWAMDNLHNKQGADKRHMLGIPLGGGVNLWFNDRMGMGLQCNYIIKPYKNVANDIEGTVRWMWRFGGQSKKPVPVVSYVEVDRIVEVPIEVIKEVPVMTHLYDLVNNVYFDFDSAQLTTESEYTLDQIAEILKKDTQKRFLIIGYTDAKGNIQYNKKLSEQRAKEVVDALTDRGVPNYMLKYRGVGKGAAIAEPQTKDAVREGDRKVGIEVIHNTAYWDYLK